MQPKSRLDVIHIIPHPVSGLRFVAPLVQALGSDGRQSELWVETIPGLERFYDMIPCKKRLAVFNLSANPGKSLLGGFSLWRDFRRLRPRCVEAHSSRGALIPLFAAKLAGVPVRIYHNHGLPYLGYTGALRFGLQWLERLNINLATRTLTVSHGMRNALMRDGLVDNSHCHVIEPGSACGIDLAEFRNCSDVHEKASKKLAIGMKETDFVVLFVGRAHKRKGLDFLLQTWERHFATQADMKLVLLGIKDENVESVLNHKTPKNIHSMGYVTDLRPSYCAADVIVLPSEHEGFGYALLEGAACACCLIASDIPGPDAILRNGENGFLVPVGDQNMLADYLRVLRDDPQLRKKMAAAARSSAEAFDRKIIIAGYLGFMRTLLDDA